MLSGALRIKSYLMAALALSLVFSLASCTDGSSQPENKFVQDTTIRPPADLRFSNQRLAVRLRPSMVKISVPANELWGVDVLEITPGFFDREPLLGKAWDWVNVRFALVPEPREYGPDTDGFLKDPDGNNLLLLRLMFPLGGDGDPRKDWRLARLEPDDENSVGIESAEALHRKPIHIVAKHQELGLDEYEQWGEFHKTFFTSGSTIIRCWYPPYSPIKHACESSFNMGNGILVIVIFPYGHLDQWKNLLDFAHGRANGYALVVGNSSTQLLQMQDSQ
jgi:hypothetical protein